MINDELERWRAVFTAWGLPPSSLKKAMKYVEDDDDSTGGPLGGCEPEDAGADADRATG